jgi:hypothetical protein
VTSDLDDPFATVKDTAPATRTNALISGGRYRLPRLDGSHKPNGWMRVSNLVSAYSDQFGLRMWEIEQTLRGVKLDHGLYLELLETEGSPLDRQWVEQFIEQCKKAAGGSAGADHGNERHAAVEGLHFGVDTARYPSETRRMLALYQSTLQRHGLTPLHGMQERRVLVSDLEVVGTLDNIVTAGTRRCPCESGAACGGTGFVPDNLVADLKTQRKFWTFLEIAAQLACYAHGDAMWDPELGKWVPMPPVRQDVALVLWMPRGSKTVEVYEVDIVAGWKTAQRAHGVVLDRSAGKQGRAWLRPAPPVTVTEEYAAMFAGVDSLREGRALVDECKAKGIWCQALADSAAVAVARLTKDVVR